MSFINYDYVLDGQLRYLLTEREYSGYDFIEAVDANGDYWTIGYPIHDGEPLDVQPCQLAPAGSIIGMT
jgi:hypothetical protein